MSARDMLKNSKQKKLLYLKLTPNFNPDHLMKDSLVGRKKEMKFFKWQC